MESRSEAGDNPPMSVRYAPSPTGSFHAGNLRTAWISHFWSRRLGLPWVVRIEDIDFLRVLPGAAERQLSDLADLGLVPDEIQLQTTRRPRHWELFVRAVRQGQVYPCSCSRKELADALSELASAPHGRPPVYSGHCRRRPLSERRPTGHPTLGWRFKSPEPSGREDFLVARTGPSGAAGPDEPSFTPAYAWACAIDDLDGGHALLVRAWDLIHVVSQQRAVQQWLADAGGGPRRAAPAVFHCAVVTGPSGERLEKRTRGVTLPELAEAGHGPSEITRAFEASFAGEARDFDPGEVWGESRRTLSLKDLFGPSVPGRPSREPG